MAVKVAMRLAGLDLRETEAYLRIPEELSELGFQAKGPISYAVMYSDARNPAYEAADWARLIAKLMPGVRVVGVYEELLNAAQIAARCGVAPEAVRLWATGQRRASLRPFPAPHEVVEQGRSGKLAPLWSWSEVVSWVRDVLGEDPEEGVQFLTPVQVADLNAEIAHIESAPHSRNRVPSPPAEWQPMQGSAQSVTSRITHDEAPPFTSGDAVALVLANLSEVLVENHAVTARTRVHASR